MTRVRNNRGKEESLHHPLTNTIPWSCGKGNVCKRMSLCAVFWQEVVGIKQEGIGKLFRVMMKSKHGYNDESSFGYAFSIWTLKEMKEMEEIIGY